MLGATRVAALWVAVVLLLGVGCSARHEHAERFYCPMHPTYIVERQGDCPICGMRTVPMTSVQVPTAVAGAAASPSGAKFICPMHCPGSDSDTAGRCPECGMNLVPNPDLRPEEAIPPGMAAVTLSADAVKLAGIGTVTVEPGHVHPVVRAAASVVVDPMRVHYINFRFSGWVEEVKVRYVGQRLRKGELLFQIYAPSVLQAQDAYLRARDSMQRIYGAGADESKARVDQSMTKSREQLELLGLGTDFIDWLDQAHEAQRYFPVVSPVDGYVTLLDVYNGREVIQGENLLEIADLSRVWVEADLFEAESRYVKTGQPVRVTLPYDPAFAAAGVVSYVYPSLSAETRTLKVRAELPNPALELRPGMFANLELEVTGGEGLVIPDASILDTGRRQIVFVEGPSGTFTPRVVTIGLRAESGAQVLSGLRAGERVVDRAAFLLDSESRIRAAFAGAAPAAH